MTDMTPNKFRLTLERMTQLPQWLWGQAFSKIEDLRSDSHGELILAEDQADPSEANLIASAVPGSGNTWSGQMHRPLLDIDFEAALLPSSTPGHYHLYLDKPMTRSDYDLLLRTLSNVGVIQKGFAESGMRSSLGTTLRVPWESKSVAEIKKARNQVRAELEEAW